jgi:hypothetical protein
MRKNGPIALAFHTIVILFVLAPLAIVVLVAFTLVPRDSRLSRLHHGLLQQPETGLRVGDAVARRGIAGGPGDWPRALSGAQFS